MAQYGGYTGKTLRIDLTTGKVTSEDTIAKYKDFIGGTGLGYKVLWDEVPKGTKAWDPANRIIFGVGPITGLGVPCAARVSVTTLWPTSYQELPATGHMGGHWGPELKFAGWDSLIIQGKANSPVYIFIKDGEVQLREAKKLWGQGIFRATAEICAEVGSDCHVAAIGQAGENLVRESNVMCDRSHSAGGAGSVLGSKNLKAIAVKGTGSLRPMVDKAAWRKLVYDYVPLMGANNQGVVPATPQAWAEYYSAGSRWRARKGLFWGSASPPLDTGDCSADDLNKMGLRTHKGQFDHGEGVGDKHTVRIGGCYGCPIRCHVATEVAELEQYGVARYQTNTCIGNSHGATFIPYGTERSERRLQASQLGVALGDDYGVWPDYCQIARDFVYAHTAGLWKKYLDAKEYDSIPWKLLDDKNPAFLLELYKRWAYKTGKLGQYIADGPEFLENAMPEIKDYHIKDSGSACVRLGIAKHHSAEDFGQVGILTNLPYNRDGQNHTHINFSASGLPLALLKEIGKELFGTPDAVEARNDYKPMNEGKAKYAVLACLYKELHDSLTMCNWTQPLWVSPLKAKNYRGDPEAEAKFYSAVTGFKVTKDELENMAQRIFTMHRALTMRYMGEKDMRGKHDVLNDWNFDYPKDKQAFTPGNYKMDRADMDVAKDMFYEKCGWDKKTGAPTKATLEKLGLSYVATELGNSNLLP